MSYYGTSGPKFVLRAESGGTTSYTFPAPHSISDNPWIIQQTQKRDINNVMQVDSLKYKYQNTMVWKPTDKSGSTYLTNLVEVCNWKQNNKRSILFFPHSDKTVVHFEVIVTQGTPYYFTKVPYNAFTITVTSKKLFDRILTPDALANVDVDGAISVGTTESDLEGDLRIG
jgi:hypothetical protein